MSVPVHPIRLINAKAVGYAISILNKIPVEGGVMYQIKFTLAETKRSLEQNRLMWVLLTQLSKRGTWWGQTFNKDDWKDICTASLNQEQRMTRNMDGTGFIFFGVRTRKLSTKKMTELIDFIYYLADSDCEALNFDGFEDAPLPDEWERYIEERCQ